MNQGKCPQCGGDPDYPLLTSFLEPKTLCANDLHRESLSMMLRLSFWKFLKLKFNRE